MSSSPPSFGFLAGEPPVEMPREIQIDLLSRLSGNDIPLGARLACKVAAEHFSEPHHRSVDFSQPLPPHAPTGPLSDARSSLRSLTLYRKLGLLSKAAASGCEANMETAWRLLNECLFPELLLTGFYLQKQKDIAASWPWQKRSVRHPDAGKAAVESGNISMLSWLLRRCPAMFDHQQALEAAALHRTLPELQEVWRLLSGAGDGGGGVRLGDGVLDAAAASPTPDAVQKMEWVLEAGSSSLRVETAAAAVSSGHVRRLLWLLERGCSFRSRMVLEAALRNSVVSVLEWLVVVAGCPLPDVHNEEALCSAFEAAAGSGLVYNLLWLQLHGLPRPRNVLNRAIREAARCGKLEAVRFLHEMENDALLSIWVMDAAVGSGSVETAAYLKAAGCAIHESNAWGHAKQSVVGNVGMLRWLLDTERLQGNRGLWEVLAHWSGKGRSEQLLMAVQLMVKRGDRPVYDHCYLYREVEAAAAGGELGVLRYLHQELGWELVGGAMVGAARGGCEDAVEWLWERGCRPRNSGYCYAYAARNGDRGMMECLWGLGLRWGVVTLQEVLDDCRVPLPALQWMWDRAPALYGRKDLERAIRRREASVRRSEAREQQVAAWLREKLAEL